MKIGLRTGVRLLTVAAFLAAFHGAKVRAVLAADPSSEDAYQLVQEATARQILEMLKSKGDAQQIAERLLNLSQKAEIERSRDEAAIAALVSQCVNTRNLQEQDAAARSLAAAHGEYAVPALLPHLASNDIDTRAAAILALRRIGSDAVLPLAASLGSGSEMQQRNVAGVLASLGDDRAVPALMKAAKSAGVVGSSATEALGRLGAKPGDAAAAYLAQAAKYFGGDPLVLKNYDKTSAVWSMADGKLTGTEVLRSLYGYELAEQSAYDALAATPGYADAEAMIALVAYAEQASLANLSEEAKKSEMAQAAMASLAGAPALAASVGADGLLRAFTMAAKMHHSDAALLLAEAMPAVWGGRGVGADNPLVMALGAEDRGIRYAAAIALLRVAPAPFPAASAVATIAGQAAAERATKQVLVLDSDSKNAMNCQRALNDAGFHAVAFTDASAALAAAKSTGGFDAILVRSRLADLTVFQVLDEIGRDVRTMGMKKLVMVEGAQAGEAEADYQKRDVAGYTPTSVDATGIVNKVKEILASPEGDAGRMKANALSISASAALEAASGAVFPLKDAEAGLLDASADGADEDVRVAALAALGNCATPNAQGALRGILSKADNSAAVRAGAAGALGRALRGQAPAPETFDALLEAMGDADAGVRNAAGAAIGLLKLTPAQAGTILNKRRV